MPNKKKKYQRVTFRGSSAEVIYDRLVELENGIENGNVLLVPFGKGQKVWIVEYALHVKSCGCCGQDVEYKTAEKVGERTVHSCNYVGGKWVVKLFREGKVKWFCDRNSKNVFATKKEAEKALEKERNRINREMKRQKELTE